MLLLGVSEHAPFHKMTWLFLQEHFWCVDYIIHAIHIQWFFGQDSSPPWSSVHPKTLLDSRDHKIQATQSCPILRVLVGVSGMGSDFGNMCQESIQLKSVIHMSRAAVLIYMQKTWIDRKWCGVHYIHIITTISSLKVGVICSISHRYLHHESSTIHINKSKLIPLQQSEIFSK
jgi:hypothetical protein